MDFRGELLCEVVQEVQPLLVAHHAELMLPGVPLDPCWQDYALLEQLGRFAVYTAREGGALVGYAAFHVNQHLQSSGFCHAVSEVFYLMPEFRRGASALRFLRYCHEQLTERGARHIAYHCKLHNNLAPLLHRIGYSDEEHVVGCMT